MTPNVSSAWVDRYAPTTVDECFLPKATKQEINAIIESGDVPTMIFSGPAGIGKTATANAICKQLDLESLFINASLVGIDAVRTQIIQFASTVSFNGLRKVIILDEGDGLTVAAQEALRGIINEFANNVSFILTANFSNKLMDPLLSRMTRVDFLFPASEKKDLAIGLFGFIKTRLEAEAVDYDPAAVQRFIVERLSKSTDIRATLIAAQKIAKTGTFQMGSLALLDAARLQELVALIKSKDFLKIRTWVGENSDIDNADIVRYIYDNVKEFATGKMISNVVLIINEYQYKHAFVADKELNTSAMLVEISVSV